MKVRTKAGRSIPRAMSIKEMRLSLSKAQLRTDSPEMTRNFIGALLSHNKPPPPEFDEIYGRTKSVKEQINSLSTSKRKRLKRKFKTKKFGLRQKNDPFSVPVDSNIGLLEEDFEQSYLPNSMNGVRRNKAFSKTFTHQLYQRNKKNMFVVSDKPEFCKTTFTKFERKTDEISVQPLKQSYNDANGIRNSKLSSNLLVTDPQYAPNGTQVADYIQSNFLKKQSKIKNSFLQKSPFFEESSKASTDFRSTTILNRVRQDKNNKMRARSHTFMGKKISKKAIKLKNITGSNDREVSKYVQNIIDSDYGVRDIKNLKKLKNVSYLFSNKDQSIPKKSNLISLMEPPEMVEQQRSEIGEIRNVLQTQNFPIFNNRLFDIVLKMKLDVEQKEKLRRKMEFKLNAEVKKFQERNCNFIDSYKFHGCYERNSAVRTIQWLEEMTKKYNRNNKEFLNVEDYLKSFKDILSFANRELIDQQEKRCKETSVLLRTLYMQQLRFFDEMSDYLATSLNLLDKQHKEKLKKLKDDYDASIASEKMELRFAKERLAELTEEMGQKKSQNKKLRAKLSSDYVVIRTLREELVYSQECLYILKQENEKIEKLITESTAEMVHYPELQHVKPMDKITKNLKEIESIHFQLRDDLGHIDESHREQISARKEETTDNYEKVKFKQAMAEYIEDPEQWIVKEVAVQAEPKMESIEIQAAGEAFSSVEVQTLPYDCDRCKELSKEKKEMFGEMREKVEENMKLRTEVSQLEQSLEEYVKEMQEANLAGTQKVQDDGEERGRGDFEDKAVQTEMTPDEQKWHQMMNLRQKMVTPPTILEIPNSAEIQKRPSLVFKRSSSNLNPSHSRVFTKNQIRRPSFSQRHKTLEGTELQTNWSFESDDDPTFEDEDSLSKISDQLNLKNLKNFIVSSLPIKKSKRLRKTLLSQLQNMEQGSEDHLLTQTKLIELEDHIKKLSMSRRNSRRGSKLSHISKQLSRSPSVSSVMKGSLSRKKKRRPGVSPSGFKFSHKGVIINRTKKKNNQMMSNANLLFNEILQRIRLNIAPNKGKLIRNITLVKELGKIYHEFEIKNNKKAIKFNFNIFIYKFLRDRNSHKKILTKKYKQVRKFFKGNF